MAKRAVLLGRVSGKRQEEEQTIQTQVAVMEAYCAKNGLEIVGRYLDQNVRSAIPMEERPEGGRLLRDAAQKPRPFDIVLVYAIDRLSRYRHISDPVLIRLKELGVAFDSATENLDLAGKEGKVLYAVKMAFAELERDTIEQRMRDGRVTWAGRGWQHTDGRIYSYWMGGQCPYGYRVIEIDRHFGIVPDEDPMPGLQFSPAEVVRCIFRWFVIDRISLVPIANRLNSLGIPTHGQRTDGRGHHEAPRDSRWHMSTVTLILRNTIYKGIGTYAGVERTVPPIIAEDLWARAQDQFALNCRRVANPLTRDYMLSGKLRCSCGAAMVGCPRYDKKGNHREKFYYTCSRRQNPKRWPGEPCVAPRLDGHDLEARVWCEIEGFVKDRERTLGLIRRSLLGTAEKTSDLQQHADQLRATADTKAGAMKLTLRAYTREAITEKEFDEEMATLRAEQEDCQRQADELDAIIANQTRLERRIHDAEAILEHLATSDLEDPKERRRIIDHFVVELVVGAGQIVRRYVFNAVGSATPNNSSWKSGICCITLAGTI